MGRLFYLLHGRCEVAAPLPRHGALPAADLMKVQGHVGQMANIHQSNKVSDDDEGREESSTGLTREDAASARSPSDLAPKTFKIHQLGFSEPIWSYLFLILEFIQVSV